jgi:hypothetical protein
MTERRILEQRRSTFTFDLIDDGGKIEHNVSYSIYEPPGTLPPHTVGEMFITSRKIGSGTEALARDAAILLSLAVQFNCPLDVIQHALTRNMDGSAQTFIGRAVDRTIKEAAG